MNEKRAYTLIEVMIAIVLFAIVMASGFACLKMGMSMVDNSRHHTRVSQIMQSEIERLRSMPWATFDAINGAETTVALGAQFVTDTSYANYSVKRTITQGVGDSKKISLTANWVDLDGKPKSRIFVTLYTKGGLYDYIQ